MAKKYPIGIQNFEDLITNHYAYVDKTALVYKLINTGKIYFLSRPRRFGKSMLLSTLEAYFQGKKNLFKGLAMEQLETEWIEYPVFHLDLNSRNYSDKESLLAELNSHLERWESLYGNEKRDRAPEERLKHIIRCAYEKTGRKVVVLVDEYDKPLQQVLHNEKLLEEYRAIFKGFYGVFKSADQYLRFVFMTGVSKFGKVSVFSDLNNLNDISMWSEFEAVCGLTKDELLSNFEEEIRELGKNNDLNYEETCKELKSWYDGYHFCEDSEGIYNPFSLLNVLQKKKFGQFWFATGTPTFLVEMLKKGNYNMLDVEKAEMLESDLARITIDTKNPIQILFQTGYLTIKEYDKRTQIYTLDFPNEEVKKGFYECLAPVYLEVSNEKLMPCSVKIRKALLLGKIDDFMTEVQTFLKEIVYIFHANQKTPERHFQEIFYILILSGGLTARAEEMSSLGRSDIVTETNTTVFVFELKTNKSAEQAIQQIEDKSYLEKYRKTGKTLYAVGVQIDNKIRNIADWRYTEI